MSRESSDSIDISGIWAALRYLRREAEVAGLKELAKILEEAESNWEKTSENTENPCLMH